MMEFEPVTAPADTALLTPTLSRGATDVPLIERCTLGYSVTHGYINIVSRIIDMVIRGGENVYPDEVEEFLYCHPQVQDVQVVGTLDQKYREELCARIIVRPGQSLDEEFIRAFCKGQIAYYKVPRYIRFVLEFPMTVIGKIQKFKIRDAMNQPLGLQEDKTA